MVAANARVLLFLHGMDGILSTPENRCVVLKNSRRCRSRVGFQSEVNADNDWSSMTHPESDSIHVIG